MDYAYCGALMLAASLFIAPVKAVEAMNDEDMSTVHVNTGHTLEHLSPLPASGENARPAGGANQSVVNQGSLNNAVLHRYARETGHDYGGTAENGVLDRVVSSPSLEQPVVRILPSPAGNDGSTRTVILPGENHLSSALITDPSYNDAGIHIVSDSRLHELTRENVFLPSERILVPGGVRTFHSLEVSSETVIFGR